MLTPGLLPDQDVRPRAPLRAVLALAFAALAVLTVWAFVQLGRRNAELERLRSVDQELRDARSQGENLRTAAETRDRLAQELRRLQEELAAAKRLPAPPPAPRAPELRVLPADLAAERLTQGLQDFRSARYAQAESAFLRAVPDSWIYLVLSALARADLREAALFLARAMQSDPDWLRRIRPRDLFGTAEEYARVLGAVEARAAEDPLDPEAKLLLAYLHYHEKGAAHAKALVVELGTAKPDHAGAKSFREALER
jgi:tetratricopeptide (TPR) repeat protein